jgi:nucleobase:cation symporter-1, NCS1 family
MYSPRISLIQTAYIFGILINAVGFAGSVGQTVPIGATYIYNLNFFGGFIVSSVTYYGMNRIWPAMAVPDKWTEDGDQWDRFTRATSEEVQEEWADSRNIGPIPGSSDSMKPLQG